MTDLSKLCVTPRRTLREVMRAIDANFKGVALVVDDERRLKFVITDGDLRRAMLQGLSIETSVEEWARLRPEHGNRSPVTAPAAAAPAELIALMRGQNVRHLPLVDREGRVCGIALLSDLLDEGHEPLSAVVMAGGFGTRLHPLTEELPKPMLPVGDRPLMERIVEQLRDSGIKRLVVATHYKAEAIVEHFGDGKRFGVDIDYVKEDQPLGTAGALGLMPAPQGTQLVINGDVLTQVNFRSMLAFHRDNKAVMTVGVRDYEMRVPYGVVETEGVAIRKLSEKPVLRFFVNAGIYLLEPEVRRRVDTSGRLDMTDLIARLLEAGLKVVSFPISEYWLDVGGHEAYLQAQKDAGKDPGR